MTKRSQINRGYNQAEELAKEVSRRSGIAVEELLVKVKETTPQKTLSKKDRMTNLIGAYRVLDEDACLGKRIILVDDIMTTGSTGSECTRMLEKAGAKEVFFLCATSLAEQK
jgi:ComF family protein